MDTKIRPMTEREKEIKRIEYNNKANEKRDEMNVPIEIRILAGIPYTLLLMSIVIYGLAASYAKIPGAMVMMFLSLLAAILIHHGIRIFCHGVGLIHYLFGMALVDRKTGYMMNRQQVLALIIDEFKNRFTLTRLKHMLEALEGPFYRSISMRDIDVVFGYRKQATILRYYLKSIKDEFSKF
jgi:hypothetical protein